MLLSKVFNETYDDERTKEAFYREYDTLVNKLGETKGILKLMDFGKHDITKFFFFCVRILMTLTFKWMLLINLFERKQFGYL